VYAIVNPDAYAGEMKLIEDARKAGTTFESTLEPLPDFIEYLNAAESMSCPPWELFEADETPPPKWWWREAQMIWNGARAEARRQLDQMRK
jgi:hypothetical protein